MALLRTGGQTYPDCGITLLLIKVKLEILKQEQGQSHQIGAKYLLSLAKEPRDREREMDSEIATYAHNYL